MIYNNYYLLSAIAGLAITVPNIVRAKNPTSAFFSIILASTTHLSTKILKENGIISSFSKDCIDNAVLIFPLKEKFWISELTEKMTPAIKGGIPVTVSYAMMGAIDQWIDYLTTRNTSLIPNNFALKKSIDPHIFSQPVKFAIVTSKIETFNEFLQTALGGAASYAVRSLSMPAQQTRLFSASDKNDFLYSIRSKLFSAPDPINEAKLKVNTLILQQIDQINTTEGIKYKIALTKAISSVNKIKNSTLLEALPEMLKTQLIMAGMDKGNAEIIQKNAEKIIFWSALRDADDDTFLTEGFCNLLTRALSGAALTVIYGYSKMYPNVDTFFAFLIRWFETFVFQKVEPKIESWLNKFFALEVALSGDLIPLDHQTLPASKENFSLLPSAHKIFDFALASAIAFAPLYTNKNKKLLGDAILTSLFIKIASQEAKVSGKISPESAEMISVFFSSAEFSANLMECSGQATDFVFRLTSSMAFLTWQSDVANIVSARHDSSLYDTYDQKHFDGSIFIIQYGINFAIKSSNAKIIHTLKSFGRWRKSGVL